jgi:tRNA A58 N-methylase Trm61
MVDMVVLDIPATNQAVADLYSLTEPFNTILGLEAPAEQGHQVWEVLIGGVTKKEDVVDKAVQGYSVPAEEVLC